MRGAGARSKSLCMNKLIAVLVLSSVGVFAVAGCAVEPGSEQTPASVPADKPTAAEEENIGKTEAALASGGNSFSCGALGCTCNGDFDCNNLFSGGACGSWPAKCYVRGPAQYCICAPWVRATTGAATTAASGAATTGVLAR
jgi:hypothetical protein